jgi:Domain of unknown function (DUF4326)
MATLITQRRKVLERLPGLRGRNIGCWCPLPEPGERDICHVALLRKWTNNHGRADQAEAKKR